jgi:hypothetical protein
MKARRMAISSLDLGWTPESTNRMNSAATEFEAT